MGLLFFDGFDRYPDVHNAAYSVTSQYWVANSPVYMGNLAAGRFGGKCLVLPSLGSVSRGIGKAASFSGVDATIGFAMKFGTGIASMSTDVIIAQFGQQQDNNEQICLTLGADAKLRVYRGNKTTLLGTQAVATLVENGWFYIEFSAHIDDAAGSYNVAIDGTSVLSGSGVDTKQQTTAAISHFTVGGNSSAGSRPVISIDDLYVRDDLTMIGPCFVETIYPNGDTANKAFERSSGADNYALIDDVAVDTDYVRSATSNARDLYFVSDLATYPATVFGVMLNTLVYQEEAGPGSFRSLLKSGELIVGDSPHSAPSGTGSWEKTIYTTDPQSALPWQGYSINSLKVGFDIG